MLNPSIINVPCPTCIGKSITDLDLDLIHIMIDLDLDLTYLRHPQPIQSHASVRLASMRGTEGEFKAWLSLEENMKLEE